MEAGHVTPCSPVIGCQGAGGGQAVPGGGLQRGAGDLHPGHQVRPRHVSPHSRHVLQREHVYLERARHPQLPARRAQPQIQTVPGVTS